MNHSDPSYVKLMIHLEKQYSELVDENENTIENIKTKTSEDYESIERKFRLYLNNLSQKRIQNLNISTSLKPLKGFRPDKIHDRLYIQTVKLRDYVKTEFNICRQIKLETELLSTDCTSLYLALNFFYKKFFYKYCSPIYNFLNEIDTQYLRLNSRGNLDATVLVKYLGYSVVLEDYCIDNFGLHEGVSIQQFEDGYFNLHKKGNYVKYNIYLYEYEADPETYLGCKIFTVKDRKSHELIFDSVISRNDAYSNNYFVDFLIPYILTRKVVQNTFLHDDSITEISQFVTSVCLKCGKPKIT